MYKGSDICHVNGKLMCELYFKTVERELRIKQKGYDYEEIWDIEWSKQIRSAKIIQHAWRCYRAGRRFKKLKRYAGHDRKPYFPK